MWQNSPIFWWCSFRFFQDLRFVHIRDFCTPPLKILLLLLSLAAQKCLEKEIKVISNQLDWDKGVKYVNLEGIEKSVVEVKGARGDPLEGGESLLLLSEKFTRKNSV